jgi:hypothetical protein
MVEYGKYAACCKCLRKRRSDSADKKREIQIRPRTNSNNLFSLSPTLDRRGSSKLHIN